MKLNFKDFKNLYPNIQYWEDSLNEEEHKPSLYKTNQHENKSRKIIINNKSKSFSKNDFDDIQYWRLEMIDLAAKLIGDEINGDCMEIGAGKGLGTAYLSSKKNIKKVISLDYSLSSLCELQPKAHYNFKSTDPSKIERVYGSYNNIKVKELSFIFAFGALHNSTDLKRTFQEIYNSLSANGYLISSDMSENFSITLNEENFLTNRINPTSMNDYGKECTYRESNDYFRSIIDYIFFAKQAGFRVYPFIFDKKGIKKTPKYLNACYGEENIIKSFYPINARGRFDNTLLICYKEMKNISSSKNIEKDKIIVNNLPWKVRRKIKNTLNKFIKT